MTEPSEPKHWSEIEPRDAVDIVLPREDIVGPLNEMGEPCPWPWKPQQYTQAPDGRSDMGSAKERGITRLQELAIMRDRAERVAADAAKAVDEQIVIDLRAGRWIADLAREAGRSDTHVRRLRNEAGIPARGGYAARGERMRRVSSSEGERE